jgi:hypothetical protein
MAKLNETVYLESAASVDAEAGVLRGVKLLGMESRNRRRYKREGMVSAVPLYEGLKIYVDHPKRSDGDGDRSMKDWAGIITKARFESDGIYGDVKLRKESEHFRGIIEAATDFPTAVGFSHVADGESDWEGETEIVESIRKVFSVDLVTDPATTGGFFESTSKPKKRTVKSAVESLPEGPIRKRLVEMVDAGYIDGSLTMDGDDKPTDPLTQMSAIVNELIAMLGETMKALAMKKDTPAPAPVVVPEKTNDEAPTMESLQKENAALKEANAKLLTENSELVAKAMLLESGREASPIRVKSLASAAEADRKELLESWDAAGDGERPARSPALIESGVTDASPERIKETFAAMAR